MLIYRAVNTVNGKSYIGKTEKTLEVRRDLHIATAKQQGQFAFHRAINKYGIDAFEWHVLETCDSLEKLNYKEKNYIKLYESFGTKGYNMTAGGGKDSAAGILLQKPENYGANNAKVNCLGTKALPNLKKQNQQRKKRKRNVLQIKKEAKH